MQSEPKVGVAQIVGKLKGQQIDPLQRDGAGRAGEAGMLRLLRQRPAELRRTDGDELL